MSASEIAKWKAGYGKRRGNRKRKKNSRRRELTAGRRGTAVNPSSVAKIADRNDARKSRDVYVLPEYTRGQM